MSNLIQNGGFETAASFCLLKDGCTSNLPQWIAPWTLTKGADFQIVKTKAFAGSHSMDLNTDTQNTIGQNVPVTPGSKYLFTVHVNGNNGFQGTKTGFVRFGGVTAKAYLPFSHLGNDYKTVSTTIEASSSNMLIQIGTTTPGKFGPIIDEVSLVLVSPKPPPTTVPSKPLPSPVIANPVPSNPLTPISPQKPVAPISPQNPLTPISPQNPLTPISPQNPVISSSTTDKVTELGTATPAAGTFIYSSSTGAKATSFAAIVLSLFASYIV
jgi:hypothetical protein